MRITVVFIVKYYKYIISMKMLEIEASPVFQHLVIISAAILTIALSFFGAFSQWGCTTEKGSG